MAECADFSLPEDRFSRVATHIFIFSTKSVLNTVNSTLCMRGYACFAWPTGHWSTMWVRSGHGSKCVQFGHRPFYVRSVTGQHMTVLVTGQYLSGPVTSQGVSSLVTDHFVSGQSRVTSRGLVPLVTSQVSGHQLTGPINTGLISSSLVLTGLPLVWLSLSLLSYWTTVSCWT